MAAFGQHASMSASFACAQPTSRMSSDPVDRGSGTNARLSVELVVILVPDVPVDRGVPDLLNVVAIERLDLAPRRIVHRCLYLNISRMMPAQAGKNRTAERIDLV